MNFQNTKSYHRRTTNCFQNPLPLIRIYTFSSNSKNPKIHELYPLRSPEPPEYNEYSVKTSFEHFRPKPGHFQPNSEVFEVLIKRLFKFLT